MEPEPRQNVAVLVRYQKRPVVLPISDQQFQPREKPTILMVEDEALVRMVMAEEFRAGGFRVIECATADEALELLRARMHIDLLFTDVRLPGELDGIELAQEARRLNPSLPVIVASAHLAAAKAAQFDAFLAKPFPFEAALALIKRLIDERDEGRRAEEEPT
jgi:two-component system, response regulator PdtaR